MKLKAGNVISNLLFFGVLAFFLWQRGPEAYRLWQMQQGASPNFSVMQLNGEELSLPIEGEKLLVIFWATWCGPCSVEMKRIQGLIDEGKVPANQVVAISSYEDHQTVQDYVTENKYTFLVAYDPEGQVAKLFQVKSTPTMMLVNEEGQIDWMTMGISPSLSLRLTTFFK